MIDLLRLITEGNSTKWNNYLALCKKHHNYEDLAKTYRGLQEGMNKMVKDKLISERISIIYLRLQKSLEDTAREIFRKKYKSPVYGNKDSKLMSVALRDQKKQYDLEFEKWLKKARF